MSIVVKHSPDLGAMSEMAYQGGKGQYNQWLANFKQQQENAKTQALLGGFGTGGRLGLGIAGMRQQERMQNARLAHSKAMPGIQAAAQSAQQLEDDSNFAKTQAGALFDAAAERYPMQPQMWREVMNWPRKQQESLLNFSHNMQRTRYGQGFQRGPTQIASDVASQRADQLALGMGSDRFKKARDTIVRLEQGGQISNADANRYMDRLEQNASRYGNQPNRPKTPQERVAEDTAIRTYPDGSQGVGHYEAGAGGRTTWKEDYRTPTTQEARTARIENQTKILKSLPGIQSSIENIRESMQGMPVPDAEGNQPGSPGYQDTYEPLEPAELERQKKRLRMFEDVQDGMLQDLSQIETGEVEHLPVLTQDWINRINNNPKLSPSQKHYYMTLQKLNPSEYVLDRADLRHYRQGAWDTGDPARTHGSFGEYAGDRGPDNYRPRTFADESPLDPPPPPMPTDEKRFTEQPPPVTGWPRRDPDLMTQAEKANAALDVIPRLRPQSGEEIQRRVDHQDQAKRLEESESARRIAVKHAHDEHVSVSTSRGPERKQRPGSMKARTRRKVLGEVTATVPLPRGGLPSGGAKLEVQFERLYNDNPTIPDRVEIRFAQSMLRKYGYDTAKLRREATPQELAAWDKAMTRLKQLRNKRR